MYHRPICVKCQVEMRPETNGVGLLDMFEEPTGSRTKYSPYKLWDADLYKCPTCGHEIVTGFGQNPISEHYQQNFDHTVNSYRNGPGLYINNP